MKIHQIVRGLVPLFFVVLANAAWATDSLPPVDSFFQNPDKTLAVLSPKGNYVAYVTTTKDGAQSIEFRETANLNKGDAVINTSAGDRILALDWVNENRLVFEIERERAEFVAGTDVVAINRDGSNPIQLMTGNFRYVQEATGSAVKNKMLPWDYRFFGTTHDESDDILVTKLAHGSRLGEISGTRIYRLNTKTQKLNDMLEVTQPANVRDWVVDQNDFPRIAYSEKKEICTVSYLAPESETWSEISSGDCYKHDGIRPFYFESPTSLYVTKNYNGIKSLYRYDLAKKQLASAPFITLQGFDFNGALVMDYPGKKILGIKYDGDAWGTMWLDPKFKEIQHKIDLVLNTTNNFLSCGSDCLNSPAILVKSTSDRQPTKYFIYNVAQNHLVGFAAAFPKIEPKQMGTRDFAYFTARDGMKIPVYYTLPPGKVTGPMPTIVLVHGGPWVRGSSWEWEAEAQFLATRGYVVIQPEFRGSLGFGSAFFKAGWKQWGLTMQDDLADAALWAVKKGWADPKRVGIMGASYGGYATLMGLIKNPEIFRCGVEWAGLTDLTLRYNTPQSDASSETLDYDLKTLVGDPVADAAMFQQNSPLQNTDKLTQPLLIAHGQMDRRVPIVHATELYSAVKEHNKNVEWIVYSDEPHGWYHQNNRIDFWNHVEAFLDKNLKTVSD